MMNRPEYKPFPPLHIRVSDCPITVFRVESSPRLMSNVQPEQLHSHFTYEVFFVMSGTLSLVTEQEIREYQDSVLIIPPHLHHVSIRNGESYCLLFSFDDESAIARQLAHDTYVMPIDEDITFYMRKLTEKTLERTEAAECAVHHLAALIFSQILYSVKLEIPRSQNRELRSRRHIGAIEEYINKNLRRKLTLSEVADAVYLSTKQTTRVIEKEYGCSFSDLLLDKRLANAAYLLKNTDLKISEIIEQTFCHAPTYFYQVFKEKYGMSPLQYRRHQR